MATKHTKSAAGPAKPRQVVVVTDPAGIHRIFSSPTRAYQYLSKHGEVKVTGVMNWTLDVE